MTSRPAVLTAVVTWLKGAPGWLGGALAGAQAAALSLALVLVPSWAIVAAAPPAQGASNPDWGAATSASVRLWLLAFGVPWDVNGTPITLAPLGLTGLTVLMLVELARRFASKTWTSWLCAVAAFAGLVAFVTTLTWAGAEDTSRRAATVTVVAALLAAPSVAFGIWRAHGATLAWVTRIPIMVRASLRMTVALVGAHVVLAALVGVAWTIAGRHVAAEMATSLEPDAAGGLALAAMQSLFVPTVVVWFMAWVTGTGFDVGLAHFAPTEIVQAPLPAVPLLGGMPTASGGILMWAPLLLGLAAAVVRLQLRERLPQGAARAGTMVMAVALAGVTTAGLGWAATGAIGPGTLAVTGPSVAEFAGMTVLVSGVGVLAGDVLERLGVLLGFVKSSAPPKRPAPRDAGKGQVPGAEPGPTRQDD